MRYAQHRSSKRSRVSSRPLPKKALAFLFISVAIATAVIFILRPKAASQETFALASPSPSITGGESLVASPPAMGESEGANEIEEIDLFYSGTRSVAGFARRGEETNLFTHVIVADLSAIDLSTTYYEAWLVKPGITDFFSTGEMFAREDGKFGLVWETPVVQSGLDIWGYSRVIITREQRDGNSSPAATHVAEGNFEIE